MGISLDFRGQSALHHHLNIVVRARPLIGSKMFCPVRTGHTLLSLYLFDRMSSIRISYGVSSYSMGVLVYSVFFSLTPLLSSWITWTHSRAQSWMSSWPNSLSVSTWDLLPETFSMKVVSSTASLTRARQTARKWVSASEVAARWCL